MSAVALRVTVLYCPAPRQVHEWHLTLPAGATLIDAVHASGWSAAFPDRDPATLDLGVWGRRARGAQLLREGDRVEIYQPLQVDPKLARRERFRRQGSRAAGLFATRKTARGTGA